MPRESKLFAVLVILSLTVAAATAQQAKAGKWFDNYVLIVLENQDYSSVISNNDFMKVASTGILHTNYHGVSHPSQPNCKYKLLLSWSTFLFQRSSSISCDSSHCFLFIFFPFNY